jgi:hypothetical protein
MLLNVIFSYSGLANDIDTLNQDCDIYQKQTDVGPEMLGRKCWALKVAR